MSRLRTTVFGGSFNPIHNGHIRLSRHILQEGLADEVWLLISPQNPLKQRDDLLDEDLRLHLAETALRNEPHIRASDFEFGLPRPSYTWNTLRALSQTYAERDFSLLIGADNWHIFDRWAHAADILAHYPLLIYPREGYAIDPKALPQTVRMVDAPLFPYSSTEVRQALAAGQDCSEMLPEAVRQEIEAQRLYLP